jgi:hypothetical protein
MDVFVYACDTAVHAAAARLVLIGMGYAEDGIIVNGPAENFSYNATQFAGGAKTEVLFGQYIVIGKK